MTAHELERAFRSKGELRGGILFLRPKDAVSLIEAAREHGIRVLGIDGFILFDNLSRHGQKALSALADCKRSRVLHESCSGYLVGPNMARILLQLIQRRTSQYLIESDSY